MNDMSGFTLLTILAHPDDESFGMGGTLALYATRGVKVHYLCATRGEVGDVPPEFMDQYDSVAELRVAELNCAAQTLGLAGVHYLGYRDSGMSGTVDNQHPQALAAQPLEKVAKEVADVIRKLHSQVVLTFDPIGGYKHPDHIAIHRATVSGFRLAGDANYISEYPPYTPQKLYFHFFPRQTLRWTMPFMPLFGIDPRRYGRNKDIDLVDLVKDSKFPTHARIDYKEVIQNKETASACHASQLMGGPPRKGIFGFLMRRNGHIDHYMRAVPPPAPGVIEKDLFSDVHV